MGCVHETLERRGAAIRILRSKKIDPVITPIAGSGKLSDWHEFNRRDPEIGELLEIRNYRVKGSFWREASDMQFVKNAALKRSTLPIVIRPTEEIQINDLGRTMDSLRLIAGRRIRQV